MTVTISGERRYVMQIATHCEIKPKMKSIPRNLPMSVTDLHNELREADAQNKKEDRHLGKVKALTRFLRSQGVVQGNVDIHNLLVRVCRGD